MNCTDVRENLSAYIDDMLDKQIRDMMARHLETCKGCREELAGMRSVIETVRDAGAVQAPEDFLDTLHQRLETESFWTRVKEMLFVPAQIKIPLEFATISIIGVLIFSLYSVYYPQEHLASFQSDMTLKSADEKAVVHEGESDPSAASVMTDKDEASEYVRAVRQQPIELVLILPQQRGGAGDGQTGHTGRIPASAPAAERQKDSAPAGYKATAAGRKADDAGEMKAEQTGVAEEKNQAAALPERTLLYDSSEIVRKLHELIGLSSGRILSEERSPEEGRVTNILAEVPAGQYRGFVEKVLNLAQVKEIPSEIPDDRESPVLIRIRLAPER